MPVEPVTVLSNGKINHGVWTQIQNMRLGTLIINGPSWGTFVQCLLILVVKTVTCTVRVWK